MENVLIVKYFTTGVNDTAQKQPMMPRKIPACSTGDCVAWTLDRSFLQHSSLCDVSVCLFNCTWTCLSTKPGAVPVPCTVYMSVYKSFRAVPRRVLLSHLGVSVYLHLYVSVCTGCTCIRVLIFLCSTSGGVCLVFTRACAALVYVSPCKSFCAALDLSFCMKSPCHA